MDLAGLYLTIRNLLLQMEYLLSPEKLSEKLYFMTNFQIFILYRSCLMITGSLHICILKTLLQHKIILLRKGENPD